MPAPAVNVTSTSHKAKNFLLGGMSGIVATTFVQPIDMVKVRIQVLAGENPGKTYGPIGVASEILAKDGFFKGFYKGIDSAYMR